MSQSGRYFVVSSEQVQLNREGSGSARKAKETSLQQRAAQVARFAFQEQRGNPTAVTIEHKYGRNCVCNHRSSSDCSAITR